jgi:hypothetical protein
VQKVFAGTEKEFLQQESPEMPPSNPMAMMSGLGSQPVMMLSTIGLGYLVNTLFSGFALVRLPFPLTPRFRVMTHRDLDLSWLDSSYVSSMTWYMLTMYGSRPLMTLVLSLFQQEATEDVSTQQGVHSLVQPGGPGGGGGAPMGPQFNPKQAFGGEMEQLKFTHCPPSATLAAERALAGPKGLAELRIDALRASVRDAVHRADREREASIQSLVAHSHAQARS